MAKFSDLPAELLLMILDRLAPTDADTFCVLSRNVRAVSASFLENHMNLKRKYTHRTYCRKTSTFPDGSLADLLRDVLQTPEFGYYVRTLQIDGHKYLEAEHIRHSESMELFEHTIQDCAMIEGQLEKQKWIEQLNVGDEDPVIAMLLLMLPNLTDLRLADCRSSYCIQYMAMRISGTKDKPALTRLSAIELGDSVFRGNPDNGDLVVSLSSLPSVKHLSASNLRSINVLGNDFVRGQINDRDFKSRITHISFANCAFYSAVLSSILTWSKNLTSFSYCSTRGSNSFAHSDYKWIRDALLAEAKDTLRDLKIYSYNEDFMGDLKDFTVLQNVSTSSRLLFGLDRKKKHTLAQILPATIITLRLRDVGDLGFQCHLEILEDLVKTKATTLPKLSWLQYLFSLPSPATRSARKAFKEQVKSAGERANIRYDVKFVIDWPRDTGNEVTEASGWSKSWRR